MKHLIFILFCLVIGSESYALSCMRPNPARTFNWLHEEPNIYHIAYGTLSPVRVERVAGAEASTVFTGQFLGQKATVTVPVSIRIGCSGPWCGSAPKSKSERLVYLEKTDVGYIFHANACGGSAFDVAKESSFKVLKSCIKHGKCSDTDIASFER